MRARELWSYKALTASVLVVAALWLGCGSNGTEPDVPTTTTAGAGGTAAGTSTGGTSTGGSAVQPGGPVDIAGVANARHTGGLPTIDGRRVRDHVIIRSGHLGNLDAAGCDRLGQLQIQSVVDLRQADGPTGATSNPDAPCVAANTSYHLADIVKILPPSGANYLATLIDAEPKLAAIFAHIGHDAGLPAILHCVIGRDRASLITGLVLLAVGVSGEDVVTDFLENQEEHIKPDITAECMQVVVDRVAAAGGIDAYLQQHGVTAAQIAALKDLALE